MLLIIVVIASSCSFWFPVINFLYSSWFSLFSRFIIALIMFGIVAFWFIPSFVIPKYSLISLSCSFFSTSGLGLYVSLFSMILFVVGSLYAPFTFFSMW